jgi:hypothetical protein
MSFGVDALGGLSEKLKQLLNETQEHYESLVEAIQLYKKGKVNERQFFGKIAEYLVASSALNFLSARVILELKSAISKGSSIKSPTTGAASYSPSTSGSGGFGIGGFVGGEGSSTSTDRYVLPEPQQLEPTFKPVDMIVKRSTTNENININKTKNCRGCGSEITSQSKFCKRCGNSQ